MENTSPKEMARRAVWELMFYGHSCSGIAKKVRDRAAKGSPEAKTNRSTISRIAGDEPAWSVSHGLAAAIEAVAKKERKERIRVTTIETCNAKGTVVDAALAEQIDDTVRQAVVSKLLKRNDEVQLPEGVTGVLAGAGEPEYGVYVVVVDPRLDAAGKRELAHELEHIADRLRKEGRRGGFGDEKRPRSEF